MSKLSIELVPQTAWWSNVRSNVTRAQWEVCKRYAKAKTAQEDGSSRCIVCGGTGKDQGRKHDVEAHEIWDYDDERQIQTLVDIIPLCPMCHQVKHIGRSQMVMNEYMYRRLLGHVCRTNGWFHRVLSDDFIPDTQHAQAYVDACFSVWAERSKVRWELDITFLKMLGLNVPAPTKPEPFEPFSVADPG